MSLNIKVQIEQAKKLVAEEDRLLETLSRCDEWIATEEKRISPDWDTIYARRRSLETARTATWPGYAARISEILLPVFIPAWEFWASTGDMEESEEGEAVCAHALAQATWISETLRRTLGEEEYARHWAMFRPTTQTLFTEDDAPQTVPANAKPAVAALR